MENLENFVSICPSNVSFYKTLIC